MRHHEAKETALASLAERVQAADGDCKPERYQCEEVGTPEGQICQAAAASAAKNHHGDHCDSQATGDHSYI